MPTPQIYRAEIDGLNSKIRHLQEQEHIKSNPHRKQNLRRMIRHRDKLREKIKSLKGNLRR